MLNALGEPQSLLLLGGTSDIALAVAEKYAATGGLRVVLAARPGPRRDEAAARLAALGHDVEVLDFDATDTASHPGVVEQAAKGGDPERARQLESLRLARTEMLRQLDVTTHEARKQQLGQAIAELDRRIKELSK